MTIETKSKEPEMLLEIVTLMEDISIKKYLNKFSIEFFQNEIFKYIVGYEGLYIISNYGRIWTLRYNKFLKFGVHKTGHLTCILTNDNSIEKFHYVHRLVLSSFKQLDKLEVCRHLDGNPINNHVNNLESGDMQDNADDRSKHNKTARGESHGKAVLTEKDIIDIKELYKAGGYTHLQLSEKFCVSRSHITRILNEYNWRHLN